MAASPLDNIILAIKWVGSGILILAALSLLLKAVNVHLHHIARRHVWKTDLDLIGTTAEVTRTIRPWRPGLVRYVEEPDDTVIADAISEKVILKGSKVLITAIGDGQLRVLPVDASGKPGAPDA